VPNVRTRYIASLLLTPLLLCIGSVRGQEIKEVDIELTVEVRTEDSSRSAAIEFQDALTAELEPYGLIPNFEPTTTSSPHILLTIINDIASIGILDDHKLTDVSSILYAGFDRFLGDTSIVAYDIPNTAQRGWAVNYVAGGIVSYVGNCEAAADQFDKALQTTRPSVSMLVDSINFYSGNCALRNSDFQTASMYFERALGFALEENYAPSYPRTTTNLAWIYMQLGRSEDAFALLDYGVSGLDPSSIFYDLQDHVDTLVARSQLYALAFRFDEAIADMNAAIELNPDYPYLYVERGQRILLLYEWDRALADYNYALVLDPYYADAYYYRGILYASVPEGVDARAEAVADFQRYLDLAAPLGTHTADAQRYITEIQAQLDALGE
jgi:tetratricopeptide (TPR) repeat protein